MRSLAKCGDRFGRIVALVLALAPGMTSAAELTPVPALPPAPLGLVDLDGRRVDLAALRGEVVLVNFWASWCRPCVDEMPGILRLQQQLRDQPFRVVGINVGEAERRVRTAARRMRLDFTILLDNDSVTFGAWGGQVLPTSFILDRIGRIRFRAVGPLDWDDRDIVATLRRLASEGDRPAVRAALPAPAERSAATAPPDTPACHASAC